MLQDRCSGFLPQESLQQYFVTNDYQALSDWLGWQVSKPCTRLAQCSNPNHMGTTGPITDNRTGLYPWDWAKVRPEYEYAQPSAMKRQSASAEPNNSERDAAILADYKLFGNKSAVAKRNGVHRNTVALVLSKAAL
jgi:hypothetical protein